MRCLSILPALVTIVMAQENVAPGVYLEQDGLLVVEVESAPLNTPGPWELRTEWSGYLGTGYYYPTSVGGMGGPAPLIYNFEITNPGDYWFAIRNNYSSEDITIENDCFLNIDDMPVVDYKPQCAGISGNDMWIKVWSHRWGQGGPLWNWETGMDCGNDQMINSVIMYLAAGQHTLKLGARDHFFGIDRWVLVKIPDGSAVSDEWSTWYSTIVADTVRAFNLSNPESQNSETGIRTNSAVTRITDHGFTLRLSGRALKFSSPDAGPFGMKIYDTRGVVVADWERLNAGHSIPVEFFAQGNYIVEVTSYVSGRTFRTNVVIAY